MVIGSLFLFFGRFTPGKASLLMAALSEAPCKRQQSRCGLLPSFFEGSRVCGRCLESKHILRQKEEEIQEMMAIQSLAFSMVNKNEAINLGTPYFPSQGWKMHIHR